MLHAYAHASVWPNVKVYVHYKFNLFVQGCLAGGQTFCWPFFTKHTKKTDTESVCLAKRYISLTHRVALLDVEDGALEVRHLAKLRGDVGEETVVEDRVFLLLHLGPLRHRRRSAPPLRPVLILGKVEFVVGEQVGGVSRFS